MLHFIYKPPKAFHLENIFQIEVMAYKPIPLAALEYKPRDFLSRTCGNKRLNAKFSLHIDHPVTQCAINCTQTAHMCRRFWHLMAVGSTSCYVFSKLSQSLESIRNENDFAYLEVG